MTTADINGGSIDGTAIGAASASTGAFTTITASTSLDVSGAGGIILSNDETITNTTDGTVLINGIVASGTGSAAGIFQSNGNHDLTLRTGNSTTGSITITDGDDGDISITPEGTGSVVISKADINSGAIDNTAIGATTASTGKFTTLNATGAVTIGAGGNEFTITESSDDIVMEVKVSDKDLTIKGNDGGSAINALVFDMSEAGKATFNDAVVVKGDLTVEGNDIVFGNGETISNATDGTIALTASTVTTSSNATIGGDLTVTGNDINSSSATALTLAGANVTVAGEFKVAGSKVGFFNTSPVVKTSVADLTDSSGGSSDGNTVAAIAAASGAISNAADLDDTKNAIATLTAKVNAILNALQSYGLL